MFHTEKETNIAERSRNFSGTSATSEGTLPASCASDDTPYIQRLPSVEVNGQPYQDTDYDSGTQQKAVVSFVIDEDDEDNKCKVKEVQRKKSMGYENQRKYCLQH